MTRLLPVWSFGVLALGVCLIDAQVTRSADDDDDDKEDIREAAKATAALKKLTDAIAQGKEQDIAKLREELNKTTDLKHIQWVAFKTRPKGGAGVGDKPGAIVPDGIEAKLNVLTKKQLPEAQLKTEAADLIRLAQVVQATAEINDLIKAKKDDGVKTMKDWVACNQFQKDGAQELIDAVKANDPAQVQNSAKTLYVSCTACHGMFRGIAPILPVKPPPPKAPNPGYPTAAEVLAGCQTYQIVYRCLSNRRAIIVFYETNPCGLDVPICFGSTGVCHEPLCSHLVARHLLSRRLSRRSAAFAQCRR